MINPHTDRKKDPGPDPLLAGARMRLRPIAAALDDTKVSPESGLPMAEHLIATTAQRLRSYTQSISDGIKSRRQMHECDASIKKLETIFSETLGPWFSPAQWGPLKDGMNSYQLEMWNFMLRCKFARTGTTDFEIAPGQIIKGDFKEFTQLHDKLTNARASANSNFEEWWQTRIDQRRDLLSHLDEVTCLPEASINSNKAMRSFATTCRSIAHAVRGFDISQPASSPEWYRYAASIKDLLDSFEKDGGR